MVLSQDTTGATALKPAVPLMTIHMGSASGFSMISTDPTAKAMRVASTNSERVLMLERNWI